MTIILQHHNKCPRECEYYDNEGNDHYIEYCNLANGIFKITNGKLTKCPINKW